MDLMDLNPYFHGTTRRIGAPFGLGMGWPYKPVAKNGQIVHGFIEPQAFLIGPGIKRAALPGHFLRAVDRFKADIFRV